MILPVCPYWAAAGGRGGGEILLGLAQEIGNTQPELLDRILIFLILSNLTESENRPDIRWDVITSTSLSYRVRTEN